MKGVLEIALILALTVGAAYFVWEKGVSTPLRPGVAEPNDFVDCATHYPVRESYPRTCTNGLGIIYIEYLGNTKEKEDRIYVSSLAPNDRISSPLSVRGRARGDWFNNDGEFPVELRDASGNVFGRGTASAKGLWGDANYFTSYEATVAFSPPRFESSGVLVLSPAQGREDPLTIPVSFK
ncbi:hypothetical protein A2943_01790 [Candidatus Adlerbacteria bacterium RIFCSPLOWO2_01_FULL_51_16]|uniref:Bacterial spore germination immunoglobulin-like domain-containing protein n=1 Tax=Candidatus Adlerbacteria bacterium RIFCSPLOWO2_01_FULL_51_16 TaxID=1797243 RepID=A0A1F4XGZ1_9BACT|nr:MAG: hypothetical protein A2943_01790 [Candidatus Adlerbacteria bacterium RIFCSPLOWO2_01_FULL_51_16]